MALPCLQTENREDLKGPPLQNLARWRILSAMGQPTHGHQTLKCPNSAPPANIIGWFALVFAFCTSASAGSRVKRPEGLCESLAVAAMSHRRPQALNNFGGETPPLQHLKPGFHTIS